jgi:predicted metalloprotease with PDZ domain
MKAALLLVLFLAAFASAVAGVPPEPARYEVRVLQVAPPKLAVTATLPVRGQTLDMDTTRPGDIPELDARGWTALVSNLRVADANGRPVAVTPVGAAGWRLDRERSGRLKVRYEVDYSILATRGWPALREAAFADAGQMMLAGRSLFITTGEAGPRRVAFVLPRGWRAVTPWEPRSGAVDSFTAASAGELVENLMVLTRSAPDEMAAGRFRLLVVPMGHWQAVRPEIRQALGALVQRFVRLMEFTERGNYLVVLLPVVEHGGESFRSSFALTVEAPPSRENRSAWGNTIGHEIFHFWNGWRLRGADYASSQWFQEGFTEYVANASMAGTGLLSPDELRRKLADHIGKYRKLTTPLEAPGTYKGPPLYSGGALVAFSWDVMIRDATHGRSDLGDFLRALWVRTDQGKRAYEWSDLRAALDATAPRDWEAFFQTYIRGTQPLPLGEILPLAGLHLAQAEDGAPLVELDPEAPAPAKSIWQALTERR